MWEDKVEEMEKKCEMSMKNERGGSLFKDLKLLQMSQRSKTTSALKAANGTNRIVRTEELEHW